MKKQFSFIWMVFVIALLCATSVSAEMDQKLFPGCTDEKIVIGTGLPTAPYSQMIKTAIKANPNICEYIGSTGGEDNIQAMIDRLIDAGIAQADVVDFLSRTDPMVKKKIRSLVGLHTNYVHIFTLKNGFKVSQGRFKSDKIVYVRDLQQLKGVNVAAFGSGPITATLISERLGLNLRITKVDKKDEGLEMLKNGKVYAFIAMGGKPIPWVKDLDKNTITMVNVSQDDVKRLGAPYYPGKLTYKNLDITGINTIGVRNDLMVWNLEGGKGAQKLLGLRGFFYSDLNDIKDVRGAHPAWQEIERSTLDDVSWLRYEPAGTAKVSAKKKKK